MSLILNSHRLIESETRRALGAIQLIDHATDLPAVVPAKITALSASIAQPNPLPTLQLRTDQVVIRQNLRGLFVISKAPLFDQYTETFDPPPAPAETALNPLLLRFSILPQSPKYLPRSITIALPRSNDPNANDAVARPIPVHLFPSPAATSGTAATLIRVSLSQGNSPVGGALVSVFRSPRQNNDQPIATGITAWQAPLTGEAIIEINNIPRFRPGSGSNIIETAQAIEIEAVRNTDFSGETYPDPDLLSLASQPNRQSFSWAQLQAGTTFTPASNPVSIRAGQQHLARIALP